MIDGKALNQKRVFCVSDEFTRQSLTIEVDTSFVSQKVCAVLEKLMAKHGIPSAFRMDNGPEFIALALRGLCHRCEINAAYIDPGKPWQNVYAESCHSRLSAEYLDREVFWGVRDARVGLSSYRRYFNTGRLHSSLGYQTPTEYAVSYYHSQWEQSEDATPSRVASVVCTKEESNYKSVEGCEV